MRLRPALVDPAGAREGDLARERAFDQDRSRLRPSETFDAIRRERLRVGVTPIL